MALVQQQKQAAPHSAHAAPAVYRDTRCIRAAYALHTRCIRAAYALHTRQLYTGTLHICSGTHTPADTAGAYTARMQRACSAYAITTIYVVVRIYQQMGSSMRKQLRLGSAYAALAVCGHIHSREYIVVCGR